LKTVRNLVAWTR